MNILPKKSWEQVGKPKLVWSPVQLHLANQYKIYPIGRFQQALVDINGVQSTTDFEVLEIVDETYPYLTLLGVDWAFDNNAIINLRKSNDIWIQ